MEQRGEYVTTGTAAVTIGGGVQHHHILRLARRGLIPHQQAGHIRLIAVADLDTIREVCRARGYYRPALQAVASA